MSEVIEGLDASPGQAPIVDTPSGGTTETTGEDVVDSGEALFFSDLSKKKAKKEAKDDIPAETVEKLKGDGKDPKESKESKEAKGGKEEKKETKDKEVGAKEDKPKVESAKKTIKAKAGESELDIPEDAVVRVKVDGQEIEVPIKELQANYSGKTHWDKKFTELSREKMKHQQMSEAANSKIKEIFEAEDPEARFYKMAEFAGKNPVEVRRKFLEENLNLLEKWYAMSEDERKADELAFENRYLRHQSETLTKQQQLRQAETALSASVEKIRATHQIEKEQFVDRYDAIKSLVDEGKLDAAKLTPEWVAETIVKDRLWDAAESAVQELGIEFPQGAKEKKIMDLIEVSHQNGLSAKDMKDMVDELWGAKRAKAVVDEKEKQKTEFLEGAKETPKPRAQKNDDLWSFEQI